MKSNKLALIAAIALGGLMACGPIARAQNNTTPPPAGGDTTTPRPPRGGRGGGVQAILAKLDLSDEQKEKIKPVLADQREKMTALRDDSSLSQQDRRDKMKTISDATDAKLKEILTADQYTKFLDLRKQAMNGRRGQGAGGDAGAKPPANNQ